ncbi:MAG TPA: response regulator [Chloroflexota bacterium]|nr:response regulator [Chloroflexota bacterium]
MDDLKSDLKAFTQAVHMAYAHLHDRVLLQDDPLRQVLGQRLDQRLELSVERLHRILIDALEWLRPLGTVTPAAPEWRRYRHLQLRYLEGASVEQIVHELQVSPRQARRDHAEALDEVARLLWTRLVHLVQASTEQQPGGRAGTPASSPPTGMHSDLDAELASLVATAAPNPISLDTIIASVVETAERLATMHGVDLRGVSSASGLEIAVNRTILRQLLLTMLSAAIEVGRAESVEISASLLPSQAVDVVIRARRRAVATDNTGSTNVGEAIGLAAREIIERLAHLLNATSTCEDSSSEVIFRLRLPAIQNSSILLVDDNPDVALLFRRYLVGTPYRLLQARSAERALRLASEQRPAVIILDVLLPSQDGWEILHALRADATTATIPVVICSVLPDHALAYSLGVSEFLTKPVKRPELLAVLARLQCDRLAGESPSPSESNDRARRPAGPRSE